MARKEVAEYLRNLDLKKVKFGGFDQIAVFDSLKQLSDLYEEILDKEKAECEKRLAETVTESKPEEKPERVVRQTSNPPESVDPNEYQERLKELNEAIEYMGRRKVQIEEEHINEREKIITDAKIELKAAKKQTELLNGQLSEMKRQKRDAEQRLQYLEQQIHQAGGRKEQIYGSLQELQAQLTRILGQEG